MMEIQQPYCDWISVPFKDKRKGKMWMCRECGASGKSREVPKCPCVPIHVQQQERETQK